MGISDCDPIRFDLLFKRPITRKRNDVGVADFATMSACRHKVIGSASMAARLWMWSHIAFLKGKNWVMERWALITRLASSFREFVAPRYRPELYYMRGPGPASARRLSAR
ncbi:hypothetical protein EH240_28110 [Mesorhizobium tamadayense]|uniref:Uncharacterized protein n=1 Tax=Mesorhizobium tamadayense TaxID=425306 RepID=A0A3P3F5R4_9HYPH|nr:hypothetical protein [Mesorhizobium tamadayense]RRH93984.1 hypothetical protein EH240_28110 [Mesorhizobium tamadayense]